MDAKGSTRLIQEAQRCLSPDSPAQLTLGPCPEPGQAPGGRGDWSRSATLDQVAWQLCTPA